MVRVISSACGKLVSENKDDIRNFQNQNAEYCGCSKSDEEDAPKAKCRKEPRAFPRGGKLERRGRQVET